MTVMTAMTVMTTPEMLGQCAVWAVLGGVLGRVLYAVEQAVRTRVTEWRAARREAAMRRQRAAASSSAGARPTDPQHSARATP